MREILKQKEGDNDSVEVKQAKNAIVNGRKAGKIVKWTICGNCGATGVSIEAHHHNGYDDDHMTDVQWLCIACHKAADNQLRANARVLATRDGVKEARSLIKVSVLYDGRGSYTLNYSGGVHTFTGSVEEFAKFLRRVKASDDKVDPKSNRSETYLGMAHEITSGADPIIWLWSNILSQFKGIPIFMKDNKMEEKSIAGKNNLTNLAIMFTSMRVFDDPEKLLIEIINLLNSEGHRDLAKKYEIKLREKEEEENSQRVKNRHSMLRFLIDDLQKSDLIESIKQVERGLKEMREVKKEIRIKETSDQFAVDGRLIKYFCDSSEIIIYGLCSKVYEMGKNIAVMKDIAHRLGFEFEAYRERTKDGWTFTFDTTVISRIKTFVDLNSLYQTKTFGEKNGSKLKESSSVVIYDNGDEQILKDYSANKPRFEDGKGKFNLAINYENGVLSEFPLLYNKLPIEAGDEIKIGYDHPEQISDTTRALYAELVEDLIYATRQYTDAQGFEGSYDDDAGEAVQNLTSAKPYYNFSSQIGRVKTTLLQSVLEATIEDVFTANQDIKLPDTNLLLERGDRIKIIKGGCYNE